VDPSDGSPFSVVSSLLAAPHLPVMWLGASAEGASLLAGPATDEYATLPVCGE